MHGFRFSGSRSLVGGTSETLADTLSTSGWMFVDSLPFSGISSDFVLENHAPRPSVKSSWIRLPSDCSIDADSVGSSSANEEASTTGEVWTSPE